MLKRLILTGFFILTGGAYMDWDTLWEMYEELESDNYFLLEETEDHQIWLDGPFIRVKEMNIDIYPGQYLQYDETEEDYLPDFAIYVFMEQNTRNVLYDEGYTSFEAAIYNYARIIGIEENINSLSFELLE